MFFLDWFSRLVKVAFLKGVREGLDELGIDETAEANVNPLHALKERMNSHPLASSEEAPKKKNKAA